MGHKVIITLTEKEAAELYADMLAAGIPAKSASAGTHKVHSAIRYALTRTVEIPDVPSSRG